MNKDWTGNKKSIFVTLGASNHVEEEREENDYYATQPLAVEKLLEIETFSTNIWECACGEGHISKVLENRGHIVKSTDLIDRGYGESGVDFLKQTNRFDGDIITNPPYKYAQEFIEKALSLISEKRKVAMFLKLQFLEGKRRKSLFLSDPPHTVWVSSSRLACAKNGDFKRSGLSGAVAYAWFIWEKGYNGPTYLKWFN